MADTIKSSNELNIGLDYIDHGNETETTRTIYIKVPNPRANLTGTEIRNAATTFVNQQIVKDPEGNAFSTTSIAEAYTVREQKIDIDLN